MALSGPNGEDISNGTFTLGTASIAVISGITFNFDGAVLRFVMNYGQYDAIRTSSSVPLAKLHVDIEATSYLDITGFGDGFLGFKKAYYYGFTATGSQPTAVKFDYLAEPERLKNIAKTWNISSAGTTFAVFAEQCATYVDSTANPGVCTTDYADPSAFAMTTTRNLPAGIYDVSVVALDKVPNKAIGAFSTKLIVGAHPLSSMKLAEPGTKTVGATLRYDASASVAGTGSSTAYSLTKPATSQAVLADDGTRNPSFIADVPGTYILTLTVTFNGEVSASSVSQVVVRAATGAAGASS